MSGAGKRSLELIEDGTVTNFVKEVAPAETFEALGLNAEQVEQMTKVQFRADLASGDTLRASTLERVIQKIDLLEHGR